MKSIKGLEKQRWFIWAIVSIVVVLGALAIYVYYVEQTNDWTGPGIFIAHPSKLFNPGVNHTTTNPAKKLSYEAAIKAYPERFQFSQCQGTPASISVKKGSPVMLDNRDAVAHTISADTQTFKLAGYGYDVFYPAVLGKLPVSCDGKNRVTLNVEK
jgi:hypothetical protein